MTHTEGSLSALSDRELDALVDQVVFGEHTLRTPGKAVRFKLRPYRPFSGEWSGLALVIERMRRRKFEFLIEAAAEEGQTRYQVWFCESKDEGKETKEYATARASRLPRAMAMAAVLAMEGV